MKVTVCYTPREENTGAQMCFIPRKAFSELDLRPGCCVRVSENICRAFPCPLDDNDVVTVESTVSLDPSSLSDVHRGRRNCVLKPVRRVDSVEAVSVTLLRGADCDPEPYGGYEDAVKTFLEGLFVADGCYVALDVGFAPFRLIFLQFRGSPEKCCRRITSRTSVQVVEAVSVERVMCRLRLSQVVGQLAPLQSFTAAREQMLTVFNLVERFPRTLVNLGSPISRGILLSGVSGSGKTRIIESVCREVNALLVCPDVVKITDSGPGGSEKNLEAVFRSALVQCREGRTVLVFDPVDAFCPASGKPRAHRLALKFLALLDDFLPASANLFVVGVTGQLRGGFDSGLVSPGRLATQVSVALPTEKDVSCLLSKLLEGVTENGCDGELSRHLCTDCPGYSLADVTKLARDLWESRPVTPEVLRRVKNRTRPGFSLARKFALQATTTTAGDSAVAADLTWDSIGGLESVKAALKRAVEWPLSHPEVFARLGVSKPKGILLYGPPGCGKTRLVRIAAAAARAHFFALDPAEVFSPYVGESEKTISEAFRLARLGRRSVLFIDEIDAIVAARGSGSTASGSKRVHEAVLSALLNEMDGIGGVDPLDGDESRGYVLVVAATNRPGALDSALLRPGRFDWLIHVPEPDTDNRVKILESCSKRMPILGDVNFQVIAEKTQGASGADLENLCREAALLAMTDSSQWVSMKHFEEISTTMRTSSISDLNLKEIREFDLQRTTRWK